MKQITVADILGLIGPSTVILIHDRKSEEGTVFEGTLMEMGHMPWRDREVVWMRPCQGGFILEIEQ